MTNAPSTADAASSSSAETGFGPKLRLLYLVGVAVVAFMLRKPAALALLLAVQGLLWAACSVPLAEAARLLRRLLPFLIMIAVSLLVFPEDGGPRATFQLAGVMALRLAAVVAASAIVHATTTPSEVAAAARGWLPETAAVALASTLALFQSSGEPRRGGGDRAGHGRGDGSGGGRGQRRDSVGFAEALRRFRGQGAAGLVELVEGSLRRARAHAAGIETTLPRERAEDVAVVAGLAVLMLGAKVTKILPGVPFAPGFKLAMLVPLYILACALTRLPLAATLAGLVVGVLSFLMGDGRYGVFELLKHIAPGLVLDACAPVFRRGQPSPALCATLGAVAAVTRSATVLAVAAFVEGNRALYGLAAAQGISWIVFGAVGGIAAAALLKSLARLQAAARS